MPMGKFAKKIYSFRMGIRKRRAVRTRQRLKAQVKSKSNIPPLEGINVLRRVSQIWGLTLREIEPHMRKMHPAERSNAKAHGVGASYIPVAHAIRLNRNDPMFRSHERIHSAQFLVMPEKERARFLYNPSVPRSFFFEISGVYGVYSKQLQTLLKMEYLAELSKPGYTSSTERIRKSFNLTDTLWIVSSMFFKIQLPFAVKSVARRVELLVQRNSIQNLYARHGMDAVILFSASPPRVFGYLETKIWERNMVKRGVLQEKGGLTEKGMRFLRRKIPSREILKRVGEAEVYRDNQ